MFSALYKPRTPVRDAPEGDLFGLHHAPIGEPGNISAFMQFLEYLVVQIVADEGAYSRPFVLR